MCKHKKFLISFFFFFSLCPSFFSQESEGGQDASRISDSELADDDFDSFFENAEDTDEAIVTEDVQSGTNYDVKIGSLKIPIEVSGQLNTELGVAYLHDDGANDGTFYFDFKNYIHFVTRPDKYLALRGTLKTTMPKDSSDTEKEQSSHLLYIYEMYFDYLAFDRIYITAGKKKSVWGNIRLFSDYYDTTENISNTDNETVSDTTTDNVNDAQYTNILYDSRNYISGIIKVPFGNHTVTALAMYNDETNITSTRTENMSIAGSAEFVFLGTSLNIFGRRFKLKETEETRTDTTQLPIVGMELKRSILNFDVYGQTLIRIQDGWKTWDFFKSGFEDKSAFNRVISTIGMYRLWSDNAPYFGFNAEFQNIYRPEPSGSEHYFVNRFALQVGMAKIGPDKNIKPVFQWNHNITDKSGFIKTGVIFGRVMPHCDWRVGMKYEYGKMTSESSSKYTKLTIGTYLSIDLDY
ncbi:MAG: hypothetical protein IJ257_06535 [Treponema sp.]|nr:hypothetical protein [Treponema sp.]